MCYEHFQALKQCFLEKSRVSPTKVTGILYGYCITAYKDGQIYCQLEGSTLAKQRDNS